MRRKLQQGGSLFGSKGFIVGAALILEQEIGAKLR
jgi:hypothetical protein